MTTYWVLSKILGAFFQKRFHIKEAEMSEEGGGEH